jgi:hypothetical protein
MTFTIGEKVPSRVIQANGYLHLSLFRPKRPLLYTVIVTCKSDIPVTQREEKDSMRTLQLPGGLCTEYTPRT